MTSDSHQVFGIIGHPLGHSLSPLLFNSLFSEQGRKAVYCRWDVEPGRVGDFMTAMRVLRIRGASVTIPHKQAVTPFLDKLSERAAAAGAVNTLYWEDDLLCGENTDIAGFLAPLTARGLSPRRVLVLGNGGAARAVLAGLRELAPDAVYLSGRSPGKLAEAAAPFGATPLPWEERGRLDELGVDLLINTTPLGMQGTREAETPFPESFFANALSHRSRQNGHPCLAYDLVYRPRPTRFLQEARAAGWDTQDGLAMFLAQAGMQYKLLTGDDRPPGTLERLLNEVSGC